MESKIFDRIRESLLEKRQDLLDWLSKTPTPKKQMRWGFADEQAVYAHVQVLDTAIEKAADQTLGLCQVCHGYVASSHLEMDYTACVCLDHFSVEQRRQLEFELELSQTVQRAMLPQQIPDIPGLELAAFSRPAQIVGGDYFDFLRFRDDAYGLAIADVAGHGLSTGLLMASVHTALLTLAPMSEVPAEIVQRLNRLFCHNIHLTTFVTLFLGRFDQATRTLTYCNAGHNPPLVLHTSANNGRSPAWLQPTGAAIGLIEEAQFRMETVTLSPGDILLLYTDGVTEAINRREEEFGRERLAEFARQSSHLPARDLVGEVRRLLQEFTDGQPLADDTTIIACKML